MIVGDVGTYVGIDPNRETCLAVHDFMHFYEMG